MKKLLFSFFLTLSVSLSVVGQISLEKITPPQYEISKLRFSTTDEKFFTHNPYGYPSDTITIYNDDWTIYKEIFTPTFYRYTPFYQKGSFDESIGSLTKTLFNSDTLIEYLGEKGVGCSNCYTLHLISETGSILFNFPDTVVGGQSSISVVNGNYKLTYKGVNSNSVYVYSLPGSLPCNQCNSLPSGLVEPTSGGLGEMKVYPNPFNNTLQVNYDFPNNQSNPRLVLTDILGRELREIKLTGQSDNVSINTSDLPKGTIIVSLYGGQNMISKKVIKID